LKLSAAELDRMATSNGIDKKDMFEIERIAQAEGENLRGEKRAQAVAAKRQELIQMIKTGEMPSAKTAATPPAVGTVDNGYVFQGGDPNDSNSWKPQ
jgi:hypothetical protein